MIYAGNNKTTKDIDNYSITDLNIPSIVLMENAAINFVHSLNKNFNNFLIVCGKGNNGGDGYAVARQLLSQNKNVSIFSCDIQNMSKDCQINYDICRSLNIPIESNINNLKKLLLSHDIIIDSIFGTGLDKNLLFPYDKIIDLINEHSKYIISIDIPSGINGSTGEIRGTCVKADETISFVTYKTGFFNYDILQYLGKIKVINIGLPESVIKKFSDISLLDKKHIKKLFIPRNKFSHKGTFGHTLIIAGSEGYTGASVIAANSAVKTGSGLVTLVTHKSLQNVVSTNLLEAMTANFDNKDHLSELLSKSDSVAFGPGLGNNSFTLDLLKFVINKSNTPVILDADGINAVSKDLTLLKNLKNRCVLTPHLGEFSRISGFSVEEISKNRINLAKDFAKKHSLILLLKGYNTIISDGCEVFVNTTGNSSMANGGMGDSLTGIISSLISQKYNIFDSAKIGSFLHGYIGDKLSKKLSVVTADDIIHNISHYHKKLFK